jgi:acetyl-CoA carboxylase carboxyl transferase subunit alpha
MNPNYLDFEQPIAELEAKIEELRLVGNDHEINLTDQVDTLKRQAVKLTESIFSHLTAWQISQLARHPLRPNSLEYFARIFTEFDEMHGDRHFGDDGAIIGGTARLEGAPVMLIGQQKGRSVQEKVKRNFGSPRPEGYRKALRLMQFAERFRMPIFTFIDTAGAYPGIDAEERGQSEAIAFNLQKMSSIEVPIINTVIGEGGSGGALAIGVGDQLFMLQYATYAVISPEGCASILFKTSERASDAAEAMGITASRLKELELVDQVLEEPLGGAHRDIDLMSAKMKKAFSDTLKGLQDLPIEQLLEQRYQRLMAIGNFSG